jgi:hypothetical protein
MALPPIETLCQAMEPSPLRLRIRFPGGAEITSVTNQLPPSLFQLAQSLLGQASSALAPLAPIFNVVETIVAIQTCLTAVVDALGPPPDPSKLAQCLPELAKKVEAIIALLPPTSVLAMIADILDAIVAALDGTIAELRAVIRLLEKVATARLQADTITGLGAVAFCGEQTATVTMDNVSRSFASLNAMIAALNGLTSMAGLPQVPSLTSLPGDPEAAVDFLQVTVDGLRTFRDAIPVS